MPAATSLSVMTFRTALKGLRSEEYPSREKVKVASKERTRKLDRTGELYFPKVFHFDLYSIQIDVLRIVCFFFFIVVFFIVKFEITIAGSTATYLSLVFQLA